MDDRELAERLDMIQTGIEAILSEMKLSQQEELPEEKESFKAEKNE